MRRPSVGKALLHSLPRVTAAVLGISFLAMGPSRAVQEPLPMELVKEFVEAAHGDLDRVRKLLFRHPSLANATIDRGGGDWETALGAASHAGRLDIVTYLLGRGARLDIVAATALGNTELVRALADAYPLAAAPEAPHQATLLAVAEAAGSAADEVERWLGSHTWTGRPRREIPVAEPIVDHCTGRYKTANGSVFSIVEREGRLWLHPEELESPLPLVYCGHYEFRAESDPLVRMVFDARGEQSALVAIDEQSINNSDVGVRIQ